MRKIASLLAVGALALVACAPEDEPASDDVPAESAPEAVVTEEAAPEPEPDPEPEPVAEQPDSERSQRGNLIKEVGEPAYILNSLDGTVPDDVWLEFTVDDIETHGTCTAEYASSNENGHYLFLTITATTGTEWPEDLFSMEWSFTQSDFSVVGEDGVTENDVTGGSWFCLDSREEITSLGPGETVTGKVALDVAAESGTVVYKPWPYTESGWEWEF